MASIDDFFGAASEHCAVNIPSAASLNLEWSSGNDVLIVNCVESTNSTTMCAGPGET